MFGHACVCAGARACARMNVTDSQCAHPSLPLPAVCEHPHVQHDKHCMCACCCCCSLAADWQLCFCGACFACVCVREWNVCNLLVLPDTWHAEHSLSLLPLPCCVVTANGDVSRGFGGANRISCGRVPLRRAYTASITQPMTDVFTAHTRSTPGCPCAHSRQ